MNYLFSVVLACTTALLLNACTSYDVDTSRKESFAGSFKRPVGENKPRVINEKGDEEAPVYIDYSKRNPVLRHDDEFDADAEYDNEDPFEEEVEFNDYQRLKKSKQAKRNMEDSHQYEGKQDKPLSLW